MLNALHWLFPAELAGKPDYFWQVILLGVLALGARWITTRLMPGEPGSLPQDADTHYSPGLWLRHNTLLPVLVGVLAVAVAVFELRGVPVPVLRLSASLFAVWIVLGLLSSLIPDRFWAESTSFALFIVSTFSVLTVDHLIVQFLDKIPVPLPAGDGDMTVWKIIVVAISLGVALWLGLGLSQFIERRVESITRFNPSTRALLAKIVRIFFVVIALVVGLTSVGVNLSALTIFGGAFMVGLGFGLQKIVANLVSGFILLSDRSIKPGDVIELEGTYGTINGLRARYVSVVTRDGTEHLLPNEDLITHRVVNWTYSNDQIRLKTRVGISYKEDPHRAMAICEEAAASLPRVLKDPAPKCMLIAFGDSSVDLELRFWINDPSQGVTNIRSAVLLKIWDLFKAEGIEIPYPQRDLHIRSSDIPLSPQTSPEPRRSDSKPGEG